LLLISVQIVLGRYEKGSGSAVLTEDHCEGLSSQDSIMVSSDGVSTGNDGEIGNGDEGPDSSEEEEVDLRGRPVPGPVISSCSMSENEHFRW
jgi:hypothetical protein